MSKDEAAIEAEIQGKGLNAPRLNPKKIDATIVSEQYHVFPGTTMTVCALTLRNGYIVTGESAAASPENFDADIGRRIARENARNKIWALEGYLLRAVLHEKSGDRSEFHERRVLAAIHGRSSVIQPQRVIEAVLDGIGYVPVSGAGEHA